MYVYLCVCTARQATDGDGILVGVVLPLGGGVFETEPGSQPANRDYGKDTQGRGFTQLLHVSW